MLTPLSYVFVAPICCIGYLSLSASEMLPGTRYFKSKHMS